MAGMVLERCLEILETQGVYKAIGSMNAGRIAEISFSLGYEVTKEEYGEVETSLRSKLLEGLSDIPGAPSWLECTFIPPGIDILACTGDIVFSCNAPEGVNPIHIE